MKKIFRGKGTYEIKIRTNSAFARLNLAKLKGSKDG
jgi:hypothetical protein